MRKSWHHHDKERKIRQTKCGGCNRGIVIWLKSGYFLSTPFLLDCSWSYLKQLIPRYLLPNELNQSLKCKDWLFCVLCPGCKLWLGSEFQFLEFRSPCPKSEFQWRNSEYRKISLESEFKTSDFQPVKLEFRFQIFLNSSFFTQKNWYITHITLDCM